MTTGGYPEMNDGFQSYFLIRKPGRAVCRDVKMKIFGFGGWHCEIETFVRRG